MYSFLYLPLITTVLVVGANLDSHICVQRLDRNNLIDFLADALSDGEYIFFAAVILFVTSIHPEF